MFDIGWMELLLIGIVALIVVGPKDLPKLFRTVGHFMGKARGMAREFQRSMEQAADESGFSEVSRDLKSIDRLNLNSPTKSARKYAEGLVKAGREDKQAEAAGGDDAPKPSPAAKPAAARKPAAAPRPAKVATPAPAEAAPAAEPAAPGEEPGRG